MRKQTKIAAGISAAALVAVAGAMTSLAATGWVNEGGSWYYYNASGDYVTNSWKTYNGQYFYLGDEGEMWTNRLVEDGDNHYYVDANGAMVKNTWVAIPTEDDDDLDVEYRWYYFGSTGKAYKDSTGKSINGKKYGFDDEGKMLFGYVDDSKTIINDNDNPIYDPTYYFGPNEDGARHSGWLQYTDALDDRDEDYYWFYFNTSNGKKETNKTKSINGKKYSFDSEGVMDFKWTETTIGDKTVTTWFGTLEDGALAKNKWIWNKPYDNCQYDKNQQDHDDETPRWFRTDASGNLVKGQTKKVNSKWYAFDEDGVMKTGLVRLYTDEDCTKGSAAVSGAHLNAKCAYDMDEVSFEDLKKVTDPTEARALHYFSEDEEKDGSMKTGTMKIELADDEYTFCFTKTTGAAKHGYDKSNKKVYNNGVLLKAGDNKYEVVKNPTADEKGQSKTYLVGTTGNVLTSANKYKDANDQYFIIGKDGNIYCTYSEDVANAIKKLGAKDDYSNYTVAEPTK